MIRITMKNPISQKRIGEIVTLNISQLSVQYPLLKIDNLGIREDSSTDWLPSQYIDSDGDGKFEDFVFQTSFQGLEQKTFLLTNVKSAPSKIASKVYAKFVPERKDDFAWENDRIAFRMYGPALENEGEISSGVDVWSKSVMDLILDKWYQPGNNYHKNHGEGLDYYKVGPSRGCGGSALWNGYEMVPSNNFTDWKIIANGPLRTIFELQYALWNFKGQNVSEVKRISLDAGSNLNRFESHYKMADNSENLSVAIGIVKREGSGRQIYNENEYWLGYWEPAHKVHGSTGCGIVLSPSTIGVIQDTETHLLILSETIPDKPFVYYAGAAWSGNEAFPDSKSWMEYLHNFSLKLENPIEMHFGDN